MRKFQNHVTVWGQKGSPIKAYQWSSAAAPACKHVSVKMHPGKAFIVGMKELSLFPNMQQVLLRFEPNGMRADWDKVGCDMRVALDAFRAEEAEEKRKSGSRDERDVA